MELPADLSPTTCALTLFLKGLLEDGRAAVSAAALTENIAEALAIVREMHERAREELSIDAPDFSADAALWAARLTYHLAQFTVCRDIGQEKIDAICNVGCASDKSPETIWSVDLTLRQLPRLYRLARHLSGGDPLVKQMERIATEWPLSSVGISAVKDVDVSSLMKHPALARLYADRIFSESDVSRIGNSMVDDVLRRDLGIHRELAPALAQKLFVETNERN